MNAVSEDISSKEGGSNSYDSEKININREENSDRINGVTANEKHEIESKEILDSKTNLSADIKTEIPDSIENIAEVCTKEVAEKFNSFLFFLSFTTNFCLAYLIAFHQHCNHTNSNCKSRSSNLDAFPFLPLK